MAIEVNEEQPENAYVPIEVTLLGMMREVNEEQPEKAPPQIEVTLLGIL